MENNRSFYNEILTDHNLRPAHKRALPGANLELRGVNPSCGDHITLRLKVDGGVIQDGAFTGDGCAISQASADMMLDLVIGKPVEEAKRLSEIFLRMIKGNVTEAEREELEEAAALSDISHMPARVKCAVLGWHTMETLLDAPAAPGDPDAPETLERPGSPDAPETLERPGDLDAPETLEHPGKAASRTGAEIPAADG